MYHKSVLKNGIRIVTFPMAGRESATLGLWCGAGGRYEPDSIKGIAHFFEHIVFKGTKKYSCHQIKEQVEGIGGMLNAFTSEEETCYFAKIPGRHTKKVFDVLADMVFSPKIAAKDVTNERGVILEEIKMYYDLPQYFVVDELMRLVWPDHALGKRLTGDEGSVAAITPKALKEFHRDFYVPNNIVVAACGNVTHQEMVRLVSRKAARIPQGDKILSEAVGRDQQGPKVGLFDRPIEQMHVALGVIGLDRFHRDRYALSVLNVILGGNMSSRLFQEVRENLGLAYSIHSSIKFYMDTGLVMIRAGVDNAKVVKALEVILKELRKISRQGVSVSEFKRAKDYVMGQLLLGLEDTMEHMFWIGESTLLRNDTQQVEDVVKAIKRVKADDVQRVAAALFSPDGYRLSVVGPLKNAQKRQIRQLFHAGG